MGAILRRAGLALAAAAVLAGVIGALYAAPLLPDAEAALASTAEVRFTAAPTGLTFAPAGTSGARAGLVFLPGAKVPAAAYAPAAAALARAGYLVVVPEVRFGFALFDEGRVEDAIGAHPEVARWAVGGHSLGGVAAADAAARRTPGIGGLLLWAAYPREGVDLSRSGLAVAVITASEDPAAGEMVSEAVRAREPPDTVRTEIRGGNHEQFGWYTRQPRDGAARITRAAQQEQIVAASLALLDRVAAR